jgi:hypothetical protein
MFSGASTSARRTGNYVSIRQEMELDFVLSRGEINVNASEAESKSWTNWSAAVSHGIAGRQPSLVTSKTRRSVGCSVTTSVYERMRGKRSTHVPSLLPTATRHLVLYERAAWHRPPVFRMATGTWLAVEGL